MNTHDVQSVTIVPNLDKPLVPAVAKDLIEWLQKRGVRPLLAQEDAKRFDRPDMGADPETLADSSLVVCLGGDGTILRGVRLLEGAEVPVVGVNFGRVGFLSEIEVDEMYDALEQILNGSYWIEERMMLKCSITAGEFQHDYLALNEVSIERGNYQRMLELDVYINDVLFSTYTSDGLILATPTGSTAYSFSAGGPIVNPQTNLILLSPINPHSLFGRTMVLTESDVVEIRPKKRINIVAGVDGFAVVSTLIDKLVISKAEARSKLIRLRERSFYNLFKDKLRVWDSWLR